MTWLKILFRELGGLFVDDNSFAVAILAWLILIGLVSPRLPFPATSRGPLLLVGLLAILLESVVRRARRR